MAKPKRTGTRRGGTERGPIPEWAIVGIAAVAWGAIAWWERRSPSRARRENPRVRSGRNATMAALSTVAVSAMQNVVLAGPWSRVHDRRSGLIPALGITGAAGVVAGVLLLDYSLWWWHRINHRWPVLWRFHLVHHVDRDLDASTAIRFHFGEMSLSVLFRLLQLRLIGPSRFTASLWQTLLLGSILFHHSAIRFDDDTENRIALWIVSPRMHEIHHSDVRDETDSNWSSLLSVWDRLHGTFRLDVPREVVTIGVPAYQEAESVELVRLVAIPFVEQRDDWRDVDGAPRLTRGRSDEK